MGHIVRDRVDATSARDCTAAGRRGESQYRRYPCRHRQKNQCGREPNPRESAGASRRGVERMRYCGVPTNVTSAGGCRGMHREKRKLSAERYRAAASPATTKLPATAEPAETLTLNRSAYRA